MISDVRAYLADTLATAGMRVPVHMYPPSSPVPPFAAILPGYPYLTAPTLGERRAVGLEVHLVTSGNAQQSLDGLIEDTFAALTPTPVVVGDVAPPTFDPDTATLTARVPVTIHWED